MIKFEAKYKKEKDHVSVKYEAKNANTLEHICAIRHLIRQILINDETSTFDEIIELVKDENKIETEGKLDKNAK